VLIVVKPGTFAQSVYACAFSFFAMLVYTSCHPHVSSLDNRMYTLGAAIVFLTMLLALPMLNGEVEASTSQNEDAVAGLMISLNVVSAPHDAAVVYCECAGCFTSGSAVRSARHCM
jgi:hypothetical protein